MQGLQRVRAVLMRERERESERARAHFIDMMGRLCRTWASLFWCDCLVWADSCIRVELRQVAMKQEGESLTAEHLCMLGANILGRTAAARSIRAPHCHHPPRPPPESGSHRCCHSASAALHPRQPAMPAPCFRTRDVRSCVEARRTRTNLKTCAHARSLSACLPLPPSPRPYPSETYARTHIHTHLTLINNGGVMVLKPCPVADPCITAASPPPTLFRQGFSGIPGHARQCVCLTAPNCTMPIECPPQRVGGNSVPYQALCLLVQPHERASQLPSPRRVLPQCAR